MRGRRSCVLRDADQDAAERDENHAGDDERHLLLGLLLLENEQAAQRGDDDVHLRQRPADRQTVHLIGQHHGEVRGSEQGAGAHVHPALLAEHADFGVHRVLAAHAEGDDCRAEHHEHGLREQHVPTGDREELAGGGVAGIQQ